MPVSMLQKELRRRTRSLKTLQRKRDRLAKKLAAIDAQIAAAGGVAGGGGAARTRARNSTTLVEAMSKTLSGKTMGVTELAEAVRKNGYQSNAANFRTMVNQALLKHRKLFKKVSRGQYTTA